MSDPHAVSDRTVSWQTAFWAVFSTAGNTFIQDPGIVFSDKELPSRAIRVSPMLCLIDTIWILWQFLATWLRERDGPAAAADMVLRERGIKDRNLWQGQWYIWFLPGFYAFVQLIKLTGMQGVPFSIICARCYFAGFFVLEPLKVIAGQCKHDEDETIEESQTEPEKPLGLSVAFVFGFLLQTALTVALLADFPDKLTEGIDRDKDYTYRDKRGRLRSWHPGWYCRPLQYVQIFQAVLINFTSGISGEKDGFFTAILRHSFSVLQATFPLWSISLNHWGILASWIASLYHAYFHLLIVGLLVSTIYKSIDEERYDRMAFQWRFQYPAIVFAMLASIHYAVIYDSEGTFKPEWAEALG